MSFDKNLGQLKLMINQKQEVIDPAEDLYIEDGDLTTELEEQPVKYAFYGGLYSDAILTLERLKRDLELYEAQAEPVVREEVHKSLLSGERPSEARIQAALRRDKEWVKLHNQIIEWEAVMRKLEIWRDAFRQRSQMLFSISATRRQEMMRLGNPVESE